MAILVQEMVATAAVAGRGLLKEMRECLSLLG